MEMNFELLSRAIAIHIGSADLQRLAPACPPGNRIGALLMFRVLELALLRDGLLSYEERPGVKGEFNDSVYLFLANDRAAIETIKSELARLGLLQYSQIGVPEGTTWRCIHPSAEVKMDWLLNPERQELFWQQFLEQLRGRGE
jgi:hypothetical protein